MTLAISWGSLTVATVPWDGGQFSKLYGQQHTRFDVDVGVDEAGQDVPAAFVTLGVALDTLDAAGGVDGQYRAVNLAGVDIDVAALDLLHA